ncbi:MAG: phosphoethanolamine transferase [Enterobacteriaceae bacterium]|jgi:glucan phosphoethanolaminetransferase (alkaline phosphatase superfamily)|nr:phosphoethanolamine transferase [Enterobacteriaceae bacterium]
MSRINFQHLKAKLCVISITFTKAILPLIVIFIASKIMLKSAAVSSSERDIFLLTLLFSILNSSKKAFYFIAIPIATIYSIYSPIGMTFGNLSYQYLISFFATDIQESNEFISQIPYKNWLYPFLIIFLVFLFRFLSKKFKVYYHRNKTFICLAIILALLPQKPFGFFKNIYQSSIEVKNELEKLNSLDIKSSWGSSTLSLTQPHYDDYILIIGESARRDYHHVYGYPISNTPFMDSTPGVIIDGFTSGGTNTVASLRLMLTKSDKKNWQPNYQLGLIDLIKSAGIETYWLSNQGYLGYYDTPISAIAKKSDHKFFLKSGDYSSKNSSDFLLLDEFKKSLNNTTKGKRFFVIHLYGSHPNACTRIEDYQRIIQVKNKKYDYLSCYVSSIKKTDDVLKNINNILSKNYISSGRSYSMIYFSDHGLSHNESNGQILFNNANTSKRHYNIPLLKVSSDDTEHKQYKAFKSGLMLVDGIANWIGIENHQIEKNYDLFSMENDKNDFGLHNRINEINTPDDPAIDLTDK